MANSISKPKLATNVPKPPPVTEEQWRELEEEGTKARRAIMDATRGVEQLTADDLRIRLR
jgi:hypothetical protein